MQNDQVSFREVLKKRLYTFVLRLTQCIDNLPKGMVADVMGKQLLRSGTSVLANFVEAQSGSSQKDFINFLNHSLKSANESRVWVALLRDTKKIEKGTAQELLDELEALAKIIASSIITLKQKK